MEPEPRREESRPVARPGKGVLAPAPAAKSQASTAAIVAVAAVVGLGTGFGLLRGRQAPVTEAPLPTAGASVVVEAPEAAPAAIAELPGAPPRATPLPPPASPMPVAGEGFTPLEETTSEAFTEAPETAERPEQELVPLAPEPPPQEAVKTFAPPKLQAMGNVSGYLEGGAKTNAYMAAGAPPASQSKTGGADTMGQVLKALQTAQGKSGRQQAARRSRASGAQGGPAVYTAKGAGTIVGPAESARTTADAAKPQAGQRGWAWGSSDGGPPKVSATEAVIRRFGTTRGRSVVVFFAPWCGYCHSGVGQVQQLRRRLEAQGIRVTIVVGQDSRPKLEDLARKIGGSVVIDESNANPVRSVPAYILGVDGRSAALQRGLFKTTDAGVAWATR